MLSGPVPSMPEQQRVQTSLPGGLGELPHGDACPALGGSPGAGLWEWLLAQSLVAEEEWLW